MRILLRICSAGRERYVCSGWCFGVTRALAKGEVLTGIRNNRGIEYRMTDRYLS
jgi:hypothetical protein